MEDMQVDPVLEKSDFVRVIALYQLFAILLEKLLKQIARDHLNIGDP